MPSHSGPIVELAARCACGAVTMAVKGPIRSMFMCACLDCQKATGTGHATVAIADPADVTVTGETKSFARPADSGAIFTRYFCPGCGTPLFGQSSRAPDKLMLAVGFFDADADWYAPNQLIFARSHHDWDRIDSALPRHATYRNRGAIA